MRKAAAIYINLQEGGNEGGSNPQQLRNAS